MPASPLSPEAIVAASGIVVALISGPFWVPLLTRQQSKKAAEVSNLEATDKIVFNRVKYLDDAFRELDIEHTELKTEVAAERIIRAQMVRYLRRLVAWARTATAAETMPEPPDELEMFLD